MHIPFHSPKWVTVSLLVAVAGVVGLKMQHHPSQSNRSPLAAAVTTGDGDPYESSTRGTAHVAGLVPARDGKPPSKRSLAGASPVGSGVHISATTGRDGSWRVVGSQAPSSDGDAPSTEDASGSGVGSTAYPSSPAPPAPPTVQTVQATSNGNADHAKKSGLYTSPPFFGEALFDPLAGAKTRAVAFSEWESYRTDVAGQNILVTTDDSNFWRDRTGKLNGNTGDTDASGLNVTDAADSVILGTESADSAPWMEDPAQDSDAEDTSTDSEAPDPDEPGDAPDEDVAVPTDPTLVPIESTPAATAAVAIASPRGGDSSSPSDDSEIPALMRLLHANRSVGTAVHTDEGTTLASADDAVVIGGDGYDDDDNRAVGRNIIITRDDGNVVIGGTGDVNAQIGDSEQGAVIMGVQRVFIKGGGAY